MSCGGVGEAEEVAGGGVAELAIVVGGRDDGELLDGIPGQVSALNLLTSNIVKSETVKIGQDLSRDLATNALILGK